MSSAYADWTTERLREELGRLEKLVARRIQQQKKATLVEIKQVASRYGYTLDELLEEDQSIRSMIAAVQPDAQSVYKNPQNPLEVWNGKGWKPAWVKAHLDRGGRLNELKPRN